MNSIVSIFLFFVVYISASVACFRRLNDPYQDRNNEYGYQSGFNSDYSQRRHGNGHHHHHHGHGIGQSYDNNRYGQLDTVGYDGEYNRAYGDTNGLGLDHGYRSQYRGHHNHRSNQFGMHNHQ